MNKEIVQNKLNICQKEIHDIERFNDNGKRLRWRELKKIEKWLKTQL